MNALDRQPGTLAAGEWWRVATPLLVHHGGWRETAFNISGIALLGVFVERMFGRRRWLAVYFIPGVIGEAVGSAWRPHGAGASVGGAGLLGSLLASLCAKGRPALARIAGAIGLIAAAALTLARDIHGPSVLAGAGLAAGLLLAQRDDRVDAGGPDGGPDARLQSRRENDRGHDAEGDGIER